MNFTIKEILQRDFEITSITHIEKKINEIIDTEWNVSGDLLIRSILQLSSGSLEKFLSYFPINDPRDIVMEAQIEKAKQKQYF